MAIEPLDEERMSRERLIECLEILGWSQRHLAERLRIRAGRVRRWVALPGQRRAPIPTTVADWIERHVARVQADPLPLDWAA